MILELNSGSGVGFTKIDAIVGGKESNREVTYQDDLTIDSRVEMDDSVPFINLYCYEDINGKNEIVINLYEKNNVYCIADASFYADVSNDEEYNKYQEIKNIFNQLLSMSNVQERIDKLLENKLNTISMDDPLDIIVSKFQEMSSLEKVNTPIPQTNEITK